VSTHWTASFFPGPIIIIICRSLYLASFPDNFQFCCSQLTASVTTPASDVIIKEMAPYVPSLFLTKGSRNEREKPPKPIAGPTRKRRGHFDDFGARRGRKSRDAGNSTNCNANRKVLLFQFVSVPLLVFRPVRDFVGDFSFGQKLTKSKRRRRTKRLNTSRADSSWSNKKISPCLTT
jgi:hypothetical protein